MNPLFSVGEVVILQSVGKPECDGEYTVLIVVPSGGSFECPITGSPMEDSGKSGFGYVLDDGYLNDRGVCLQWDQSALRKKHQPGERSFAKLMQTLKSPVSV